MTDGSNIGGSNSARYRMLLANRGNSDAFENPFKPLIGTGEDRWVHVADVAEAIEIARRYVEETGITPANWHGGDILDLVSGEKIGVISSALKFWPAKQDACEFSVYSITHADAERPRNPNKS